MGVYGIAVEKVKRLQAKQAERGFAMTPSLYPSMSRYPVGFFAK
jgi:hypothetical protein